MPAKATLDMPRFLDRGYLIVRDVFDKHEIQALRHDALQDRQWKGDLLSHPTLRRVLLDDRVLDIAHRMFEETPVYYGDSTCNIGQFSFGFHKDNADREDPQAPDWRSQYTQVRFGLYLQDHAWHSGGLRVIPGSHRSPSGPKARPVYVRTRPGDLVVWNMRLDHAGAAIMLRGLPGIYVDIPEWAKMQLSERPRTFHGYRVPLTEPVRMKIPRFMIADDEAERIAMFFAMGREDEHMERYIAYIKSRAYAVEGFKRSVYGPDAWAAIEGKDIKVIDVPGEVRRGLAEGDPTLGRNEYYAPIPY
jgi:hypothetical protein